jgi:hypothetical protein
MPKAEVIAMPADSDAASSLEELFRSLGLTLTVRPADDEDRGWACTLTRPDGAAFEIDSVTFFDVDPETGDEWVVEPTPSRVLGVLAGGEVEAEDAEGADAAEETATAAKAFLGDEAYALLVRLDAESLD